MKNVKGAIRVVKGLHGEHIHILGGYRFNLKMGFRFTLTPKARFHGMVGGKEKLDYLKGSKGLVFPVKWDEPFGWRLQRVCIVDRRCLARLTVHCPSWSFRKWDFLRTNAAK